MMHDTYHLLDTTILRVPTLLRYAFDFVHAGVCREVGDAIGKVICNAR